MKRFASTLGCLLALSFVDVGFACDGATVAEVREAFSRGNTHEQKKQWEAAVEAYLDAQADVCGQPNPVAADAARRAAPIAERLAERAKAAGRTVGGPERGAYEWYEAGGHYARSDAVLLQAVRANPDDRVLYERARTHFSGRGVPSFLTNNRHRIAATRPYTPNPDTYREILAMPAKALARALEKEEKLFDRAYLKAFVALAQSRPDNPADFAAMQKAQSDEQAFARRWGEDPIGKARRELDSAQQWLRFMPEESKRWRSRLRARAAERGHELLGKWYQAPELLTAAADYFQLAEDVSGVDKVKRRAGELGERSQGDGRMLLAVQYFRVAGEDERAEQAIAMARENAAGGMQPSIEAQRRYAEQMRQDYSDPARIEAMRREAEAALRQMQQQQGSAKADDLERELGL